jgi:hypothetical protein
MNPRHEGHFPFGRPAKKRRDRTVAVHMTRKKEATRSIGTRVVRHLSHPGVSGRDTGWVGTGPPPRSYVHMNLDRLSSRPTYYYILLSARTSC